MLRRVTLGSAPADGDARRFSIVSLMRVAYGALMTALGPVLWLMFWIKGYRDRSYRERMGERFGHIPDHPEGVDVWVHAVSVGEALTAGPLLQKLLGEYGDQRICVTTTTPTGSERVRAMLGERVLHYFVPHDIPRVVSRFVNRLRPRRLVVMETERWPVLFRALRSRNVPVVIANARLSPRSMRGYTLVRWLFRSVLEDVELVAAQSEADAQRYRRLGAPRVENFGNLKFDLTPDFHQVRRGRALREQWSSAHVWIAASTHEGEEAAALAAHRIVVTRWPDAVLILVPRHPSRFNDVRALVERSQWSRCVRRTQFVPGTPAPNVFLGDSMGEMWFYLAAADVAFIGGSLVPVGGHNVLEPAVLGIPVLFGPRMHNFELAKQTLLEHGGARTVRSAPEMAEALLEWMECPESRLTSGAAARDSLGPHQGALDRLAAYLIRLPGPATPPELVDRSC